MGQPGALAPADLTIPEDGSDSARKVLSQAIGRLLRELPLAVRAHATALGPDAHAFDALLRSLRTQPGPLASVLRRPNVAAPLRALRSASGDRVQALLVEVLALVTLELAALGALPGEVRLQRLPSRFVSLVARAVLDTPRGAPCARFSSGRVVFELPSGEQSVTLAPGTATPASVSPYHVIAGDILFALEDNNPLAMVEAHPDKFGNAIDLGGRPLTEWLDTLRTSLTLVGDHLPALRAEMDLYLQQVIPVGYDAEKHLSASYREAIGTVYLTLHPSPLTMVEAIIHEFSHNKLNALFEVDDVLENAFEPLYPSPVRPDPRPLHGVLLAVHAFVPVARLYELLIEARHPFASAPSFRERLRIIIEGNREGTEVLLQHARPTRVGKGLLDELARWDRHFAKTLA